MGRQRDWTSRSLRKRGKSVALHTDVKFQNAPHANAFRARTSALEEETFEPRYLKSWTCSIFSPLGRIMSSGGDEKAMVLVLSMLILRPTLRASFLRNTKWSTADCLVSSSKTMSSAKSRSVKMELRFP